MSVFFIKWIQDNIKFRESDSADSLYDHMESQSGECLPVIYQPFDGTKRNHFADRGQILDYALSAGNKQVLDIGPGDGWPSLLIAPLVEKVTGVDASEYRIRICMKNAKKLQINNADFVHVKPEDNLPFKNNSFDGVTAASSIEQSPNPRTMLREIHRVLKPGGTLRMHYESLGFYAGSREQEIQFIGKESQADLIVYDRNINEEYVQHYKLRFDLSRSELIQEIDADISIPTFNNLSESDLLKLTDRLVDASMWKTNHPSCQSYLKLLADIGFKSAVPTYDGGWFAKRIFDSLDENIRPVDIDSVDDFLRPIVDVVRKMPAPEKVNYGEWEHWITAVK